MILSLWISFYTHRGTNSLVLNIKILIIETKDDLKNMIFPLEHLFIIIPQIIYKNVINL